jgi:hypothetical protein
LCDGRCKTWIEGPRIELIDWPALEADLKRSMDMDRRQQEDHDG